MGDASDAVYLLRWEAGKAGEAAANGPAKIKALDGEIASKTVYKDGQYRVVIKRPLAGKGDERPTFQPSTFVPVAFHAWDGGAGGATGTRWSVTSWYYLRLEPPQPNRRFVVPPVVALLTLVAMVLVVRTAGRGRTR